MAIVYWENEINPENLTLQVKFYYRTREQAEEDMKKAIKRVLKENSGLIGENVWILDKKGKMEHCVKYISTEPASSSNGFFVNFNFNQVSKEYGMKDDSTLMIYKTLKEIRKRRLGK